MDTANTEQIFIFELDGEEYALPVEKVDEILKRSEKEITEIPNVPDFVRGIINVRGSIVPVLDLEEKFNLTQHEKAFIVIVDIHGTDGGLLVDDVHDVMRVDEERIKPAPEILEKEIHADYIEDVAVLDDRIIVILDLDSGFEEEDAIAVDSMEEDPDDGDEEEMDIDERTVEELARDRLDD